MISLSTQIGINSNYLSFYFNHVLAANFHQWLYASVLKKPSRSFSAILPLISQQKYNVAIKKILQHAGITRSVVWLNPTTGEPEIRPIYEVMSSHSARRAFSGNMYDKLQDPNLICALTGHKEGSKAFARYRKIDEETSRKTISLLE